MPGNVVRLVFAGDAKDLDRAASSADRSMAKFRSSVDATNAAINKSNGGFKSFSGTLGALPNLFDNAKGSALKGGLDLGSQVADGMSKGVLGASRGLAGPGGAIALAVGAPVALAAAGIAGGLLGAAIVGGLGAGLAGIGLMFAAKSDAVKSEITKLSEYASKEMQRISKPFEKTLLDIIPMARSLFDVFAKQFELVAPQLAQTITSFAGYVKVAFEQLAPAIAPISDAFNQLLIDLGPYLPVIFKGIADSLINLANNVREHSALIVGLIQAFMRLISVGLDVITWLIDLLAWMSRTGQSIVAFETRVREAVLGAASAVANASMNILSLIASLPGRIISALGNLGSLLWNVGRDLVQGFINGIGSMISSLANQAANMAASALNAAKRALGINSPSKVMIEVGMQYGQGFVKGINDMVGTASIAGGNLATQAAQTTSTAVSSTPTPAQPRGAVTVTFSGSTDQAFATAFMKLMREGKIQLGSA